MGSRSFCSTCVDWGYALVRVRCFPKHPRYLWLQVVITSFNYGREFKPASHHNAMLRIGANTRAEKRPLHSAVLPAHDSESYILKLKPVLSVLSFQYLVVCNSPGRILSDDFSSHIEKVWLVCENLKPSAASADCIHFNQNWSLHGHSKFGSAMLLRNMITEGRISARNVTSVFFILIGYNKRIFSTTQTFDLR